MNKKNYKAHAFDLVSNHSKWFGSHPHYMLPATNTSIGYSQESVKNTSKPCDWHSTYPSLKYISSKNINATEDIVLELLKDKSKFYTVLKQLKYGYEMKSKTRSKTNRNLHLAYVKAFGELLERDPDPDFDGNVNWYFTGGNFKIIKKADSSLVYHIVGPNLNILRISSLNRLSKNDFIIQPTNFYKGISNTLQDGGIIYELSGYDEQPYLLIRQKHQISALNDSGRNVKLDSSDPFISCAYMPNNNLVATINTKRKIQVRDLHTLNTDVVNEGVVKSKMSDDHWACIRYYKNNILSYVNRHSIRLYDVQQPISKKFESFRYDFKKLMSDCEEITCIEPEHDSHIMYVGTTHNLFAVDTRACTENNLKILKWCHQLRLPPCIIAIDKEENRKIVAVGSTSMGDVRIVETQLNDDNDYVSPYTPYTPRCLLDSYELVRSKGKCLLPKLSMKQQIDFSSTGVQLFKSGDSHIYLLTQNSIGNIFWQTLGKTELKCNIAKLINEMEVWGNKLYESLPNYYVSTIANFRSMVDVLKNDLINEPDLDDNMPARLRPRWKRTIEELAMYKDILAADILEQWDITTNVLPLNSKNNNSVQDTVINWLEAASDPKPTEISEVEPNRLDLLQLELQRQLKENETLNTQSQKTSKRVVSRRTFVPGF